MESISVAGCGASGYEVLFLEGQLFLRGDGLVDLEDGDTRRKRILRRTVQRRALGDGVEEVLQVRLMNGLVEGDRDVPRGKLRGFADIDLGCRGLAAGADQHL